MTTPAGVPERDPLDFGDGPPPLDFGHGVLGRWAVDDGDVKIGLIYSHPMPNPPVPGRRCFGSINFRIPEAIAKQPGIATGQRASWELHCLDPLDVSPSLLCRTCGHHGFIRNGQWVPA